MKVYEGWPLVECEYVPYCTNQSLTASKLLIKKHGYKINAVGSAIKRCISAYMSAPNLKIAYEIEMSD